MDRLLTRRACSAGKRSKEVRNSLQQPPARQRAISHTFTVTSRHPKEAFWSKLCSESLILRLELQQVLLQSGGRHSTRATTPKSYVAKPSLAVSATTTGIGLVALESSKIQVSEAPTLMDSRRAGRKRCSRLPRHRDVYRSVDLRQQDGQFDRDVDGQL